MRTANTQIEIVKVVPQDKGYGETGLSEISTTYFAKQQKIWASRNDNLRVQGSAQLTYRFLVKSSALSDDIITGKVNQIKYVRVYGTKYNVTSISQGVSSNSIIVETGSITP